MKRFHPFHKPLSNKLLQRYYPCPHCQLDTHQRRVRFDTFRCEKCGGEIKVDQT